MQLCFSSYKDWLVPLQQGDVLVKDALLSLKALGAPQEEIPLVVKLLENPDYNIPGLTLFHGAVDLHTHDYIHILLGRGLMPKDEAFTIGFTMGSTNQVGRIEEELFCLINQFFYPQLYRFGKEEIEIFKDAVQLGRMSMCQALNEVNFSDFEHSTIHGMRAALGIEEDLLQAYYAIEAKRYPRAVESGRLMSDNPMNSQWGKPAGLPH